MLLNVAQCSYNLKCKGSGTFFTTPWGKWKYMWTENSLTGDTLICQQLQFTVLVFEPMTISAEICT